MARRRSSIGWVEGDGDDTRVEPSGREGVEGDEDDAGEGPILGEPKVTPSSLSPSVESWSSDDESAFSQPALACSNRRRVSVTVDTFTHSSPP